MKTNIAFDLDCCLIDFVSGVKKIGASQGIEIKTEGRYEMQFDPEIENAQVRQIFKTAYKNWKKHTPFFDGAIELLQTLHAKSQEPILIVTSRPVWAAHWTCQMLRANIPVPHICAFADNTFGKIMYLNGIEYFVEDRRKTVMELAAHGKKVFKPKYDWNAMPENKNVFEINGVRDLIPCVEKLVK